jgi:hypothetical protein
MRQYVDVCFQDRFFANANDVNINTYLLLSSSDLKGNIESPGWYFTNVSQETTEAMDNLMLTHGWRKFSWDNIMQGKSPLHFLLFLNLTGTW